MREMSTRPVLGLRGAELSAIQNPSMEAEHMTKKTKHVAEKDERVIAKRAKQRARRKVGRRSAAVIHQNILASE